jgi:hypothetical protein
MPSFLLAQSQSVTKVITRCEAIGTAINRSTFSMQEKIIQIIAGAVSCFGPPRAARECY